jgi:uncharacterized protein
VGTEFTDRLRKLRREDAPNGPPAGVPVWLKHKLRAQNRRRAEQAAAPDSPVPTTEGEPQDLTETGGVVARETLLAVDSHHGHFRLDEVDAIDPAAFSLLTGDPTLASLDPRRAVYLDTETTGLSGGAGTYVYMVGLGTFDGDRFRVWQGFLRGPEQERAMLAICAERIAAAQGVVSFFGKSFDRHRLEDKMRAHAVSPPFDRPHLDLYHPLARLTKGGLPNGRLGTLERALCGVERADDLPGSLAPAAWFDYLARRPHRLEGVFRHNLDDVLSLVTLAAHLGRVPVETRASGAPLEGCGAGRARALGRAWLARGDRRAALPWLERAIERGKTTSLAVRDLEYERAEALRRECQWERAIEAYVALVTQADDPLTVQGLIGWSKLLEHAKSDNQGALACCERALALLDRTCDGATHRRLAQDLARRRSRLTGKT